MPSFAKERYATLFCFFTLPYIHMRWTSLFELEPNTFRSEFLFIYNIKFFTYLPIVVGKQISIVYLTYAK